MKNAIFFSLLFPYINVCGFCINIHKVGNSGVIPNVENTLKAKFVNLIIKFRHRGHLHMSKLNNRVSHEKQLLLVSLQILF